MLSFARELGTPFKVLLSLVKKSWIEKEKATAAVPTLMHINFIIMFLLFARAFLFCLPPTRAINDVLWWYLKNSGSCIIFPYIITKDLYGDRIFAYFAQIHVWYKYRSELICFSPCISFSLTLNFILLSSLLNTLKLDPMMESKWCHFIPSRSTHVNHYILLSTPQQSFAVSIFYSILSLFSLHQRSRLRCFFFSTLSSISIELPHLSTSVYRL